MNNQTNVFMEQFKKRLFKALLVGLVFILFMVISPVLTGESAFSQLPWYIVPVVLLVTVLYGTGWYFAFNLIKRTWRKFLRVNRDATIWQALTGQGFIMGFAYSLLCFALGCVLALFVGNAFMIVDFIRAKNGQAPVSMKFKFDSDMEYDDWTKTLRQAVEYSDAANSASAEQKLSNELNLQNIENGLSGTVVTKKNDEDITTTIIQ